MPPPRLRVPLIVLAAAIAVATIEASGLVGRRILDGEPMSWPLALRTGLALWLTMAAVTPIPAWMARRFPLHRGTFARRLGLHALAALLFVIAHLALDIAVQTLQGNMRPEPFARHLLHLLAQYLATEMLIYAAVAGAFMYVRSRGEAEARRLAAETLRAQLGESQLAALQSQLAPHFLFNTLNAISTLAMKGEKEAVSRALATLAGLLRLVLDEGAAGEIPLAQELAFLDRYLELQSLRFPDRLEVRRAIADEVRDARVPRLLLQPIVENAVRHGLEDAGGGAVAVTARREGEALVLEVEDRADPGMAARPARASGAATPRIGLANTRARLQALYGLAQTLELIPSDGGTIVRIRLPFRVGAGGGTP